MEKRRRSLKEQKLNQNEGRAGVQAEGSGWRGGASCCLGRRLNGVNGGQEGEKLINTFTGDLQARQIKSSSFVEAHGGAGRCSGVCHVKYVD